jgi:AraC family transcriptional activator of mtrCDE
MITERLFENLDVRIEPFAVCALADQWRLNLPGNEFVTLHFVLDGEGVLVTQTRNIPLGSGGLAIVPRGVKHSLQCGEPIENEAGLGGDAKSPCDLPEFAAGARSDASYRLACGRLDVTYGGSLSVFDRLTEAVALDFSDSPVMKAVFEGLVAEEQRENLGSAAMVRALMNQCIILVFRRLNSASNGELSWLPALEDPQLAGALDAVFEHPEHPHTVESLAERVSMSRSSFAERFSSGLGQTPMRFVRDVRLQRAARLLRKTDLSVDGVATRVGFSSRSHFSRAFRDYYSCSPAQYRG